MTHAAAVAAPSTAAPPAPIPAHEARESRSAPPPLCPYCGQEQSAPDAAECEACRGLFEPLSRQATQNAMGPWQVRDARSPFLPGCSYDVLRSMALRGRLSIDSIIRGPTTGQFWERAGRAQGVAHLLGRCHSCAAPVRPTDALCVSCGSRFETPSDRQSLGIGPSRPLHAPPPPPHLRASTPGEDSTNLAFTGRHELSVFDAIPAAAAARPGIPRIAIAALIIAGAALIVATLIAFNFLPTRGEPRPPTRQPTNEPATKSRAAAPTNAPIAHV